MIILARKNSSSLPFVCSKIEVPFIALFFGILWKQAYSQSRGMLIKF